MPIVYAEVEELQLLHQRKKKTKNKPNVTNKYMTNSYSLKGEINILVKSIAPQNLGGILFFKSAEYFRQL